MEMKIINAARGYATDMHRDQTRDGGEPFIIHPFEVYTILRTLTDDTNLLAAAWLHDLIEDTQVTYEDLEQLFGKDIADLVNEVTHEGKQDSKGFYFPRLKTRRGIMLKFADRLSNITSSDIWDEKRQQHYLNKSKFWRGE